MADQLKSDAPGAAVPPGPQNVVITEGNARTSSAAPTPSGNIWFSFSIDSGSAQLSVNFNDITSPNIPPGQYTLSRLTTPLNLDVIVLNGCAKLAWVVL